MITSNSISIEGFGKTLENPSKQFIAVFDRKQSNNIKVEEMTIQSNLSNVFTSSMDVVLSRVPTASDHTLPFLFEVNRVLRADGIFVCYEPLENRTFEISENLKRNLTMAGFVSPSINASGSYVEVIAKKPEWETGTVQPIKLKKKVQEQKQPVAWTINDTDDIMDESDLLDEKDKIKPDMVAVRAQFDCGTGTSGGKACKNCTCGRAEQEAQGQTATRKKLTLDMLENPGAESSCGSCGLGDAFRCAGCPYRGLPAFKPGEKILLPDDFFVDQI
jgi:hypothetical protein